MTTCDICESPISEHNDHVLTGCDTTHHAHVGCVVRLGSVIRDLEVLGDDRCGVHKYIADRFGSVGNVVCAFGKQKILHPQGNDDRDGVAWHVWQLGSIQLWGEDVGPDAVTWFIQPGDTDLSAYYCE